MLLLDLSNIELCPEGYGRRTIGTEERVVEWSIVLLLKAVSFSAGQLEQTTTDDLRNLALIFTSLM
jgi:hypothetical protein